MVDYAVCSFQDYSALNNKEWSLTNSGEKCESERIIIYEQQQEISFLGKRVGNRLLLITEATYRDLWGVALIILIG